MLCFLRQWDTLLLGLLLSLPVLAATTHSGQVTPRDFFFFYSLVEKVYLWMWGEHGKFPRAGQQSGKRIKNSFLKSVLREGSGTCSVCGFVGGGERVDGDDPNP